MTLSRTGDVHLSVFFGHWQFRDKCSNVNSDNVLIVLLTISGEFDDSDFGEIHNSDFFRFLA